MWAQISGPAITSDLETSIVLIFFKRHVEHGPQLKLQLHPPQKYQKEKLSKNWKEQFTFRDGALNFGAFDDNVVVIKPFLFFNEIVSAAILASAGAGAVPRRVSGGRQLDVGDEDPLNQRERDSNNGAHRYQNLRSEIWQNCRTHGLNFSPTQKDENKCSSPSQG